MGTAQIEDDAVVRSWPHRVLDAGDPETPAAIERLTARGDVWSVHDTLEDQLRGLARTRTRNGFLDGAALAAVVEELRGGRQPERFGTWVHYPWSGRLVRLLPADLFRELRSDRNRHKITDEEQARLRSLTVGVVGLSVGNAIALTVALEGGCGRLRLADHDHLELSNLNRLRAGVQDLGLGKAELAARQVAEIDPYLDVEIHPEGITPDNVEAFLGGPPAVDVLVEECDSFPVKLLLREHARARRIPVLMETSDRGTLDVERFDEEPDRPCFHGLAGSVTSAELDELGFEGVLTVGLDVVEPDRMSARLLASMVELGQTVSTWPQLASDVTLGGATVATAVRRIGLGEPLPSGRVRVDLGPTIAGQAPGPPSQEAAPVLVPPAERARAAEPAPADDLARFLVAHAVLAPSGGNAQPWRFHPGPEWLLVAKEAARAGTWFDRSGHAALVALGAAVENVVVAAAHRGLRAEVEPFPHDAGPDVVAAVRWRPDQGVGAARAAALFPFVVERSTNRWPGTRAPVPEADLQAIEGAASAYGARLAVRTAEPDLAEAGGVFGAADRLRLLNAALHRDAVAELRFDQGDHPTGIEIESLELSTFERRLFGIASRPDVTEVLHRIGGGAAIEAGAAKAMAGASATCALVLAGGTPEDWLAGGRALQRLWLEATARGLSLQPMSALVYMLELRDRTDVFDDDERARLDVLDRRVRRLFGLAERDQVALLLRLHYAPAPSRRAGRLPVDEVLRAIS